MAVATLCWMSLLAGPPGFVAHEVTAPVTGEPVYWRAFETGKSASPVRVITEAERDAGLANLPADSWLIRRPGWSPTLLNANGRPAELVLDPQRTEVCDIYLGLRAVDPVMSLAIKLGSEAEFTTITAPAATRTHHYDTEFFWKAAVPLQGEAIHVASVGRPFYLHYLKFVPHTSRTSRIWAPPANQEVLRDDGRHFAFPGVAETAGGDLVVVCREGDAHVCPRGRIVMTRSTDRGATWQPRQTIWDSPSDERDPAILCLPDGSLVVSFNTWDSWRASPGLRERYPTETARMEQDGWNKYSGSFLMVSTDDGRTWSPPRKAPVFSPHGPVPGPGGALYWVGEEARDGQRVVAIHRTADRGQAWTRYAEVAYSAQLGKEFETEVWDEPNLVFLADGTALCGIRCEVDGLVRLARSTDEGRTWGWPRAPGPWGFPQQLCALRDGRVFMAYGYRREPFGIRGCFSRDGGRTWDLADELAFRADGRHGDLGYPYTIQLRDGQLYTVYYHNRQGTNCLIEGVLWAP